MVAMRPGRSRVAPYHPGMETTAQPILEIGVVLPAAPVGVLPPFPPGYVADRHQIQLLADLGVVLLLFEVGIEVDLARIRREQRGLLVVAPVQVVLTTAVAGARAVG